jgi:hypothetical protein
MDRLRKQHIISIKPECQAPAGGLRIIQGRQGKLGQEQEDLNGLTGPFYTNSAQKQCVREALNVHRGM